MKVINEASYNGLGRLLKEIETCSKVIANLEEYVRLNSLYESDNRVSETPIDTMKEINSVHKMTKLLEEEKKFLLGEMVAVLEEKVEDE